MELYNKTTPVIIKCYLFTSPKNVLRLAEIAASAVTALDLNTACAQAAGYEMADSHVKLARGEK